MGGILSRFKSAPPPPPPGAVVIADDATKVDLSSRGIRVVPTEICQLKHLQTLSLGFNKLTTLDPQIAQLGTLTKLTLSGNQLKALPEEIGQLTNLREVSCDARALRRCWLVACLRPSFATAAIVRQRRRPLGGVVASICACFVQFFVRIFQLTMCCVADRVEKLAAVATADHWRS